MIRFLLLSLCLFPLSILPAHALPGEAAAVIRSCGVPNAENIATSPVTNRLQRDLTYNNVIMHFVPDGRGWSFTTAWQGHLPVARESLESTMPCFRSAINEAAAQPVAPMDPTIAHQTAAAFPRTNSWGIPYLGPILLLAAVTLLLLLWPRRKAAALNQLPSARRFRKPSLALGVYRRRPRPALNL